jgi:hypothetical protein
MNISKEEKAFRKTELFSKEEVLQSFNLTIEYIEDDDELEYTDEMRRKKLDLCYKFKKSLDKCQLPKLTEKWWFYKYEFTGDGIELLLCSCEDIEVDEEGAMSSMTITDEHKLISVSCDYLTVEQYAIMQSVTPITVRQWIRRGKLRHAKKNGRDWLIPSLEEKPSRGYESVQYTWDEIPQDTLEEFPFLKMYTSLFIYQDENDKTKYICILENYKAKLRLKMEFTRQEIEKLELALISTGKVDTGTRIQFVPNIRTDNIG